jgi:hypothetical protein
MNFHTETKLIGLGMHWIDPPKAQTRRDANKLDKSELSLKIILIQCIAGFIFVVSSLVLLEFYRNINYIVEYCA